MADLPSQGFTLIKLENIQTNPYQPRQTFDDVKLEELALSIKEHGVLQPLLVRSLDQDKVQLIAGERRLRASKIAGLSQVPCRILAASDEQSLEMAILENVQRQDLQILEEAEGYQRLMDEFHYTQERLAKMLGKSRAHITNTLRLLKLDPTVKQELQRKNLTPGHGKLLASLEPESQRAITQKILANKWSVRETEKWLSKGRSSKEKAPFHEPNPEAEQLQEQFQDIAQLKTEVRMGKKFSAVTFYCHTLEELEGLMIRLEKGSS